MKKIYNNMGREKGLLFLGLFLFSLSLVFAAPTLISPASSSVVSGDTYLLNVTNGTLEEIINCTWYAYSPSTANSSYVNITIAVTNESEADFDINTTFDSTILEDSNDYSIFASCANETHIQNTTANTGITIHNTVPQTPSSLSPSAGSTDTDGSVTFSGTVTGANTTGCTLYFSGRNPGSSYYTMTHTGDTCTYTLSSVLDETYVYYIQASDGTNTTNSAETRFNVLRTGGSNNYLFQNPEAEKTKQQKEAKAYSIGVGNTNIPGWLIALIIVIVLIIIIAIAVKK